jgi:glycosyltransferase involved in cell wall biosynthesis
MQYLRVAKACRIIVKSVNIVCHNVYPLFDPSIAWGIGGMETRAALLARGLKASGRWQVRMVVNDFGQPDRVWREGIEFDTYQPWHRRASDNVNPRFARRKWFPALNLDRRDLPLIWQIPLLGMYRLLPSLLCPLYWRRRPADIVCCFGNNGTSAQVIADCRRLGIPTALCIASDDDLSADYRAEAPGLNDYGAPKWMAHYALENADHIFVQTEGQLRALASRFARSGELIRNPVDISGDGPSHWPDRAKRDTILWIGRSDTFHKQPLLLLELAKRCPDLPFLMIMNRTHADVFDAIQAQRPSNLTIVERVPHREIWNYYRRARVFVSTSAYEGFPNTFLQCAVAGVPVASLSVDPEGILSAHACGLLAGGSLDRLEQHVRTLWTDAGRAERQAWSFHRFALEHHGLASQVERFESLLKQAIDAPLRSPPLPWWRLPTRRFVRHGDI